MNKIWSYPGARWWKFDFHTHTLASIDTLWHDLIGSENELTPEKWLFKYMAAGIDCVAVTDHNSGAWIDKLKTAYVAMKAEADGGQVPEGFRPLILFPGVEISVQGGVHVLAIFSPDATTSDIDTLLGRVEYQGTKGDSDGVTRKGLAEVIAAILESNAIPIPAHADVDKGMLKCKDGRVSAFDANSLRQALTVDGLLAVEWCDKNSNLPQAVERQAKQLTRVLGSDCHNFRNGNVPGSRFTWVKMAEPSLEGLRLALLDGNEVSIRRSDDGAFEPFNVPEHVITELEVENARYMGNGQTARLAFSPYFNAVVGGRGSGKSTLVHALRLATRRESELEALGKDSEPWRQFEGFRQLTSGRESKGGLRPNTEIAVQWQSGGNCLRLVWCAGDQGLLPVVEELNARGQWQPSASQSITPERFPVRIFSQGQIAALAGNGRQALLKIIDEAANVAPLKQELQDAIRTFHAQRARLRELKGKLDGQAEVERKLAEANQKLNALAQSNQAVVLQAFARAQRQEKEIRHVFDQLRGTSKLLADAAEQMVLDDWPTQHFTEHDSDILAWRQEVDAEVNRLRQELQARAQALNGYIGAQKADPRVKQWYERVVQAKRAHEALQQSLAAQGVNDPQAFANLTQTQQQLESQLKALRAMQADYEELQNHIASQQGLLIERRNAITQRRQDFISKTLIDNAHVQMTVVPFGFDAGALERELRMLLDVNDERFADDILALTDGEPVGGMAYALAQTPDAKKMTALGALKQNLVQVSEEYGGRLRNYLQRKHEKPEFADHILAWFPEDDLRIQYQRSGAWASIEQGSQGQRSAALLAFLLAFGTEPLILDQPEDDLDNHLIYDLIVRQIRENKLRRQLIVVTHNPNVVVNGDAELVHVMDFGQGQCYLKQSGSLQQQPVREEVCRVMEGGREAFARRWKRLGREVGNAG